MKYIVKLFLHIFLIFSTLSTINVFAACTDECLAPIKDNTTQQLTNFNKLLVNYFKFSSSGTNLIAPTATYNLTPNVFSTLNQKQQVTASAAKDDTQSILNMSLRQEINLESLMAPGTTTEQGGDFFNITPNLPTADSALPGTPIIPIPPRDNSLNIDELLTKNIIDIDNAEGLPVRNFIRIISGALTPVTITTDDLNDKAFVTTAWSIHAKESIILSNFYQMMRNRGKVANLGHDLGLETQVGKDASPTQVEEYLATRRVGDPTWYSKMEEASPAAIQRETLYVLAEIQRQIHLNAKQDERIIATLSGILSQQLEMSKLLIKGEQAAKQAQKMLPQPQ